MNASTTQQGVGAAFSLAVAEQFYSIQGEGQTMGKPAYFLRLAGCNLECGGAGTTKDGLLHDGATWRCDSIEVWMKGKRKTFSQIIDDFGGQSFLIDLKRGVHLIITGGEPLLQQKAIINLYTHLHQALVGNKPVIEIETNGTIMPDDVLLHVVSYWNVSPKLKNSGMDWRARVKQHVLTTLANLHQKTIFKFVVSDAKDWNDIFFEFDHLIKHDQIWLMPAADNIEELVRVSPIVAEICRQHRLNYGQRLHIITWNKKTGV